MNTIEIIFLSFGLAMDAFAVAICKGLSLHNNKIKNAFIVGLYFGIFQALMPLIGSFLGIYFNDYVYDYSHYISFVLLLILGINMIMESSTNTELINDGVNFLNMLPLAVATSIDALSVGLTFAFLDVNIYRSIIIIGFITFITSSIGYLFGSKFGSIYKSKSEMLGGIILIIIGIKILLEHII